MSVHVIDRGERVGPSYPKSMDTRGCRIVGIQARDLQTNAVLFHLSGVLISF